MSAFSERGIDGEVDIRAPIRNVSGSFVSLPKDFRSATELLREPCRRGFEEEDTAVLSLGGGTV